MYSSLQPIELFIFVICKAFRQVNFPTFFKCNVYLHKERVLSAGIILRSRKAENSIKQNILFMRNLFIVFLVYF